MSGKTDAALYRWAEIQALLAEGLDYPDGSAETIRAEHLIIGDILRTEQGWGQIVGATYDRRGVEWDIVLLRTYDNVTTGPTGERLLIFTRHNEHVEILAVEY